MELITYSRVYYALYDEDTASTSAYTQGPEEWISMVAWSSYDWSSDDWSSDNWSGDDWFGADCPTVAYG